MPGLSRLQRSDMRPPQLCTKKIPPGRLWEGQGCPVVSSLRRAMFLENPCWSPAPPLSRPGCSPQGIMLPAVCGCGEGPVLGPGCWVLSSGCRVLGAGCSVPGVRSWVLDAGFRVPDPGCWVLGAGSWVLGARCWVLSRHCDAGQESVGLRRLSALGPLCTAKDWVMGRRVLTGAAAPPRERPRVMWTRL